MGPQGDKGDQGEIGPQGAQGDQGEIGPQGAQGDKGDQGEIGPQGAQGDKGDKGDQGEIGPQGAQGEQGPQGPQGEKGDKGDTGSMSPTFISVYSQTSQTVVVENPIIYDGILNQMGNIGHVPFTSKIYVWQPGYYYVTTVFHHIEACQFAIFLNGAIYGRAFSSPTGATHSYDDMIIHITPNDMINETSLSPTGFAACLETYNHSSFNPNIILNNPGGSAAPDLTASMNVILLA
jgi:hypothetical protein